MAGKRAIGRYVHFYHFAEPDMPLGGMILPPSATESNFLFMLAILIVASGLFRVTSRNTGKDVAPTDVAPTDVAPTDDRLQPGNYDIRPYSRRDTISITDQPCITRIISRTTTGRNDAFRNQGPLDGLRATHIFPLSSEEYFVRNGFARWITKRADEHDTGIKSCQNGLLMQNSIHALFDDFGFAVNPDDGFKITCFDGDPLGIDGRILDPICRNPSDNRAVFANMRGAGEPNPPEAGKRMEAELFSRLNGVNLDWGTRPQTRGHV
ncbi:hypothetical protein V1508DRAFT_407059 [Lipomyces doorenjongii]|uniref:uncharacterized protein n=1 Tax=Lipomyces doorenjongii TaxID=383834 RepID=UPI0034CEC035